MATAAKAKLTKMRAAPKTTMAKKIVTKKTAAKKPMAGKTVKAGKKAAKPRVRKFDLVINRSKGAKWTKEENRPQFEYRHFGVEEATNRRYGSHVIRIAKGGKPPVHHHVHPDCEFLLVLILKGWVKF